MEDTTWVNHPGEFALCRRLTSGDWAAAVLLHRVMVLCKLRKTKLKRFGKEWLAMSRKEWADSAGLSDAEIKDRALPNLRKHCSGFVEIRTMRIVPDQPNKLWISFDPELITDQAVPWDMYRLALNGLGILSVKQPYPYKKPPE